MVQPGNSEIGVAAGLTAAFLWTISSLFWSRIRLSALTLNFSKNGLGAAILFLHLAIAMKVAGQPLFQAPAEAWFYLTLSGVIGIVIGDICYFRSLQLVGPRQALLLATTAPLFAVGLKWLWLGQLSTWWGLVGVGLTSVGIAMVVRDKGEPFLELEWPADNRRLGIGLGVASAFCQAVGGLFSQQAMAGTACPPIEAAFIRLLVAALGTTLLVGLRGELVSMTRAVLQPLHFRYIFAGTAVGTWLGIWMSQVAFEKTDLALAATTLTTSPLFAIPVLYFYLGQRTTWWALFGSCVAVLGVSLAVLGNQ